MLVTKGVVEFVEAARTLKQAGVGARFALVGDVDPENRDTLTREQLEGWHREGVVEWWGHRADMEKVYAAAHVVCLPSYGEGLPKALIEAASSGRPIVAASTPGCKEVVRHGVNGILVPPRDVRALVSALKLLLQSPQLRAEFGAAGRRLAVEEFSEEKVVASTLALYRDLLPGAPPK